jgi:hypothetical protein
VILWLEVNEISDVLGGGTLGVARVTQARAGSADRFVFACETVSIESFDFEVIEKKREAIVFLPLPVIEGRQSDLKPEILPAVRRTV